MSYEYERCRGEKLVKAGVKRLVFMFCSSIGLSSTNFVSESLRKDFRPERKQQSRVKASVSLDALLQTSISRSRFLESFRTLRNEI